MLAGAGPRHARSAEGPGRVARTACVALRFGTVSLRRPQTADRQLAPSVALDVVEVSEADPPADVEPLRWRLLTTHAVQSLADAQQIVA